MGFNDSEQDRIALTDRQKKSDSYWESILGFGLG